ncbi:MAG TPA: peptidylprolyl isomerase [Acidimicrobiales bacterium]|nr:peptidylprolyl isomerase [Acidimicrobiales bacterium]
MRRISVLLIAAVLALGASACGDVAPFAAKVNGERISVDELNRELEAVKANPKYLDALRASREQQGVSVLGTGTSGTFGSTFVAETLTRRIYFKLVHQEVERRKLPVTDEAVREAREQLAQSPEDKELYDAFPKEFLDEIARSTAEVTVLQEDLQKQVSPQQIEEFYRGNPQYFEQFCARQIVTGGFSGEAPPPPDQEAAAKATADDIKRRLDTGQDFAAIARAESKDTATATSGGDLGCVPGSAFPPEAQAAVSEAAPAQVVGPIRTDRGHYLIQVQSKKTQPIEEVADQIRQFLESQAGNALTTFLQETLAKAKIEVNPRYGRFDREGQRPGVVPPDLPATSTTTPAEPAEGVPLQ